MSAPKVHLHDPARERTLPEANGPRCRCVPGPFPARPDSACARKDLGPGLHCDGAVAAMRGSGDAMRRAVGNAVLGLSACGYPLTQLAVRRWGCGGRRWPRPCLPGWPSGTRRWWSAALWAGCGRFPRYCCTLNWQPPGAAVRWRGLAAAGRPRAACASGGDPRGQVGCGVSGDAGPPPGQRSSFRSPDPGQAHRPGPRPASPAAARNRPQWPGTPARRVARRLDPARPRHGYRRGCPRRR